MSKADGVDTTSNAFSEVNGQARVVLFHSDAAAKLYGEHLARVHNGQQEVLYTSSFTYIPKEGTADAHGHASGPLSQSVVWEGPLSAFEPLGRSVFPVKKNDPALAR